MYGADLSLFQFHGALTWAAFFLNSDRTIYGRYGTRGSYGTTGFADNDRDVSLEGFKEALRGALELHKKHPADKKELAGKTGPAPKWRTPEAMPAARGRNLQSAEARGGKGCIHCHEVQDLEARSVWSSRPVADKLLWTYPMPDHLGLSLDITKRATVARVAPGTAAARAGFRTGDRILKLEGQPMISIADVQWVLHNADEPSTIKAEVDRRGRKMTLKLKVEKGWRRKGFSFTRNLSLGWVIGDEVAGMHVRALSSEEKGQLGMRASSLALRVERIAPGWLKTRNPAAAQVGLKKGDTLTEVDGTRSAMSEADFQAYLVQKKRPGDKVRLAYVRGGKERRVELKLP